MHPVTKTTTLPSKTKKSASLKHNKHQTLQHPHQPLGKQACREGKKNEMGGKGRNCKNALTTFDDQLCPICDDMCTCANAKSKPTKHHPPILSMTKQPTWDKKDRHLDVMHHFDLNDIQDYDLTESEASDYASLLFDSENDFNASISGGENGRAGMQ